MKVLNLDSTFNPLPQIHSIDFDSFQFSGGEPHIKIKDFREKESVTITHRIQSFNDFGLLLLSIDALRRMGTQKISVFIPYFPGARQDRLMIPGEPLTVKIYADILNQLDLEEVIILDPHSAVTPSSIACASVISNFTFIQSVLDDLAGITLIAPDAGAGKKIFSLANQLGHTKVLTCSKNRNVRTGKLSGFSVPADDLTGKRFLIVDDICDGGGTFIGLAQELKNKNAGQLYLAVTHGIFSKGLQHLTPLFETIYTTNSFRRNSDKGLTIKTIKL